MARLWQCGFELQSVTANVETQIVNGSPTIDTTLKRSGAASLKVSKASAATCYVGQNVGATTALFIRSYINITTSVNANARGFCPLVHDDLGDDIVGIGINTDDTLQFYYRRSSDAAFTTSGSATSALTKGSWYRVELYVRKNSNTSVDFNFKLDGISISLGNVTIFDYGDGSVRDIYNGFFFSATGEVNYDDIAVNNTSGSFQNAFPGDGKIIHLKPNAEGDSNTFATQAGGTAGSANNFTRVDEVTPNDVTDYNASAVISEEDLFNVEDSGVGEKDTINVVAVGGRFANISADATSAFKLEIEKTTGGTKSQSAAIIPNSTTWRTNASAIPRIYPLVTYQDPDNNNWTVTTLDSMQIGYILTAVGVQTVAVSTVWASVDYAPYVGRSIASARGIATRVVTNSRTIASGRAII